MCISESWLTADVPNSAVFIQGYDVLLYDRPFSETSKSLHGGVFVAIKQGIHYKHLPVTCRSEEVMLVQIKFSNSSFLLFSLYNAPAPSAYQWTSLELLSLLNETNEMKQKESSDIIVTGDLNFQQTIWSTMSSSNQYKAEILERFHDLTLIQQAPTQLNIVLCSSKDCIIECGTDQLLQSRLTKKQPAFF